MTTCSTIRTNSNGKGKTEVVTRLTNNKLTSKSAISGYVYSRLDSTFLQSANIIISDTQGTQTAKNGQFYYELEPGEYSIKCQSVGHTGEQIKSLIIKEKEHIIILFELGTEVIY